MSTLSIEQIQEKISDLVFLLKKEDLDYKARKQHVTELLDIRGKLFDKFKPIIKTIERVEDEIKDLKLPQGDYGMIYPLKVADSQTKVLKTDVIFKLIRERGEDPINYMKIDATSALVKEILKDCPESYTLKPGAKKHFFK